MNKVHISISVTVISIIVAATLLILSIAAFNLPAAQAATTGTLTITSNTVLTEDHYGNIIIAADNITLDGNGYTVTGNNSGVGVSLSERTGVTVKNLKIKNFATGVSVGGYSNNNDIIGNTITNNEWNGIGVGVGSRNNTIASNTIRNNLQYGIYLHITSGNTVTGNIISNNGNGVFLDTACDSTTVTGNTIINNGGRGLWLTISKGNTITSNTISNNTDGILLTSSSNHNTVTGNAVSDNDYGIYIFSSENNTLTSNSVSNNNRDGIRIWSSNNSLKGNVVSNNNIGILIQGSNNTLTDNNISNNNYGVWFLFPSYSKIYHNNFISNPTQVYFEDRGLGDLFNLPLPIGGNYWSNYDTPAEGCIDTNNNGFCDAPYVFSGGNDSLPWTRMNGWLKSGVITLTFQGYDYDNQDEVSILVNNQQVAVLPTTYSPHNNNLFANYALDISEYVVAGMNTLTFKQNIYSSGVRNLVIENSSTATTTTLYSNSTNYNLWIGGRESVTYSFSTSPFTLAFQGYDYNNRGEVSILVNDQVAYTLPTSYSPHNVKTYASYTLDISKYIVPGNSNTITFRQNMYSSAVKDVQVTHLGSIIYSNSTRYSIWIGGRESVTYTRD
ncbi:MAG: right-handed parallel beta-helix repeat-containing protein [Thaumarchaeota archaeon]|nr:right-handed parallel beta-helix repeat-containing protein [Nitrososphaerota archaeon]